MDKSFDPNPTVAAGLVLVLIAGVGALLAGTAGASWLVDAGMAPTSTFNWVVFATFAGAATIAAAVVYVGLTIVVTQRRAHRELAALLSPAS